MKKTELGQKGEKIAKVFLKKLDYVIITQNYRCSQGEIDIIATDKNELVFVEVKTRCSKKYGEAREAVNQYKKKHIKRAAMAYITKHKLENQWIRFDVIEIYMRDDKYSIYHIKNTLW